MDLSVIIVNFNVKYFLEQCLYSVIKACANIETEIFVVDNNSTDGSKEYFETKFPTVIFKWNDSNTGFAKANNSVLGKTKGDHILFLNPDTIIPEDCFEKCIAFFKTHKNCGALGVHMIDGSGKFLKESKRSFPSISTSFYKMIGLAKLFPTSKLFAKYYAGHLKEKQNNEVDVLAGAFMMLSRAALDKVKGFDEDYFMYGEDIDLSYCIQKAGFKNYYFADASIIHFKGESTQRRSRNYIQMFYAAMNMFVSKHYKEKKIMMLLTKISIWSSKIAALIFLFFRSLISKKPGLAKKTQIAVVAGQQRFGEMIHLMKYSVIPLIINGRIAADKNDTGPVIGKLDAAESIIKKNSLDQLLFCEGELSFKDIYEQMEKLSAKAEFLIHAKGSDSIVGSSNKNENGFFIAKQ